MKVQWQVRTGQYRTDKLLAKYGKSYIQHFQRDLVQDCPRNTFAIELGKVCAARAVVAPASLQSGAAPEITHGVAHGVR